MTKNESVKFFLRLVQEKHETLNACLNANITCES